MLSQLYSGVFFGDYDGGWKIGDSKTVAFALVGNEYWFYLQGASGLIKIQAPDNLTPFDSSDPAAYGIDVSIQKGVGNSIAGSVSDIYLIRQ
jgi:hypothetical protein